MEPMQALQVLRNAAASANMPLQGHQNALAASGVLEALIKEHTDLQSQKLATEQEESSDKDD